MSDTVNSVKTLIWGENEEKLALIEELTRNRLCVMMELDAVPAELEYIPVEVSLKRFNRIGAEGMKSVSQEGESMSFPDSDFNEYLYDINKYSKSTFGLGKVRFL